MTIDKYYNRHDPAKKFEKHLFIAGRSLQSAELNELQDTAFARLRAVSDVLFKDGDLVRDAGIIVNAVTGFTKCLSGAVYIAGAVRGVAPAELTISVIGTVSVGLYLVTSVVTEIDDASLLDPAINVRGYQQPGAYREKKDLHWGFFGDGQPGEFFPIYTVENGIVLSKEAPPNLDAVTQALARYDRDSAGGTYVVNGLTVAAAQDIGSDQIYTVAEGRARVFGYNVEQSTSRRITYPPIPDLNYVDSEPHNSTSAGALRVNVNRTPIDTITQVHITTEITATMVHGGYTGVMDPLPDGSVISIVAVNQGGVPNGAGGFTGGTNYSPGTDYQLTADKVDWTPGGAEIAPGSTYKVIFRCIKLVSPTAVDATGFTVTGAVVGTSILVNYNQKLPRIDRLCIDQHGVLSWLKGVSAVWNPQPPTVPESLLSLASVYQTWGADRIVSNDGVRVVPMNELAAVGTKLDRLIDLIAQQRLTSDAQGRDVSLKKGMFVDPFFGDELRDQGVSQTAAIIQGVLTLPVAGAPVKFGADVVVPTTLPFNLTPILSQPARTGDMQINPYMAFAPIPKVEILPNVDLWADIQTIWTSSATSRFIGGGGAQTRTYMTTETKLISSVRTDNNMIRQIQVNFSLANFGPNEVLASVTFDGIPVTPTA